MSAPRKVRNWISVAYLRARWKLVLNRLLDLCCPRVCIGCGAESPDPFHFICWNCWSDAAKIEAPFCRLCGDPVMGAVEHHFTCYSCSEKEPHFEAARSAARYDGVVGEAMKKYKYHGMTWLVEDLSELLLGCMQSEFSGKEFDLILPVPLHVSRFRRRGFNQSALLASTLGRLIRVKCRENVLRRIRPTTTQTNLTATQRLSNVSKAFQLKKRAHLKGKRILLIDDVMTTGATVNACAKVLKEGGAASVHVLTVARG